MNLRQRSIKRAALKRKQEAKDLKSLTDRLEKVEDALNNPKTPPTYLATPMVVSRPAGFRSPWFGEYTPEHRA